MAHMSTVSVKVGQTVSGLSARRRGRHDGRTFGRTSTSRSTPRDHPGDVYKAVNPVSWLSAHGLHP
jgi:hypothetical protein